MAPLLFDIQQKGKAKTAADKHNEAQITQKIVEFTNKATRTILSTHGWPHGGHQSEKVEGEETLKARKQHIQILVAAVLKLLQVSWTF
jgi:hypothetical protein